jgi:gamma-resorcylate decarboxylase
MHGKIAFEEHYNLPQFEIPEYADAAEMREIRRRLLDLSEQRLADMDATGIDYAILSLVSPCIQSETDANHAVSAAKKVNDTLAEIVAEHQPRYGGFATLPLQDPTAAADELERCVKELGFHGTMVNGFTNLGNAETGLYYDDPRFFPFWERAEALHVPVYLHPRNPLPANAGMYQGHPELMGASWAFTVETATHVLRLMVSGLFDRFPNAHLIIGHLGETLPFTMWRIDHWVSRQADIRYKKPLTQYLRENLYVTTSGFFRTQALNATMAEIGEDRVLFSVDYPFESMEAAATWFDNAAINDTTREKIGRTNAEHLFKLKGASSAAVNN